MAILVSCPGCNKRFNVDDKHAGKTGKCPSCKGPIKIPQKQPEVKIHTPEAFSSGGKSVSGKVLLKPIARQEMRLKPATLAIGGGIAAVAIVLAVVVRLVGPKDGAPSSPFDLQHILSALGLLLIGPPLAVAAYTLLRDENLEPYRGVPLWIRASICGVIYALLWGGFAYIKAGVFRDNPIDVPIWFVIVPPFLVVGGMTGKFSLDLETSNGFFHYVFFLAVTFVLGLIAGVSQAIWSFVSPA